MTTYPWLRVAYTAGGEACERTRIRRIAPNCTAGYRAAAAAAAAAARSLIRTAPSGRSTKIAALSLGSDGVAGTGVAADTCNSNNTDRCMPLSDPTTRRRRRRMPENLSPRLQQKRK